MTAKDTKIVLTPWASVEGVMKVGSKLAANATVSGWYNFPDDRHDEKSPRVYFSLDTKTDSQGRFRVDRIVPDSDLRVGRQIQLSSNTYTTAAAVKVLAKPGQSVTIAIGGTGRPVVGRIGLPEALASGAQPWIPANAMLSTTAQYPEVKRPDNFDEMSVEDRQAWYQKWLETDEGKAYQKAQQEVADKQRNYPIVLNTNGSFRADDVLPGTYHLSVMIAAPPPANQCGFGEELATASAQVTVPDPGLPQTDEPYEVPTVSAQSIRRLAVGDVAPAFDVPSLDASRQIKLEDFRGKYVLVDFWATWCGPCVAEIPHLKEAHEAFANDDRVVFVSLSLDNKADTALKFVEKQQMTWPQGFLGEWSKATLPNDYGVRGIPSVWLIGPDGKIVARDLRGATVKTAIQAAISQPK
jgi:thiol-disulfide isomerase/thioredoxin